jgi:integrase
MKRRIMFKVPLSDRVIALLERLKEHRRVGPLVFAGVGRVTCWKVCKLIAPEGSIHGMRATFRSWCTDKGITRDLAEMCLAHGPENEVEAAYNRADALARRRKVMDRWAGFLDGTSNVVALKRA